MHTDKHTLHIQCVQADLDAVHQVRVVVALLVSVGGRQREKVVVPGVRGFGVALVPLGLQLESKRSGC